MSKADINLRKYGNAPYSIAVVHGGPGAPGEMASVARELSAKWGVLEPLQTADTVDGQVRELKSILEGHGALPMILVGYSWGAWLVYMLAALRPFLAKKIIFVGSGPFEDKYAKTIMERRFARLREKDRARAQLLMESLEGTGGEEVLEEFGELISKADSYDPLPETCDADAVDPDAQQHIYQSVWPQAAKLRSSGELLRRGEKISCPVVAIHGDFDPHPYEGVEGPLSKTVKDFKMILLEHCGHKPWIERQAKDRFYEVLTDELKCAGGAL